MTSRRTVTVTAAALVLSALATVPALAHGSMTDPVSRVAACYAEGPESPDSAACRAAVAASGTQAFYDWNAVNIANAAGRHRLLIPDGELCSAGNDTYRGLDLARADWPASRVDSGAHTFRYRGTAPHRGTFELYVTKDGYDPSKPLTWSDLEEKPFATATDPRMENGEYVIPGTLPEKSGRHLIYSIWQRSDSPEAFYTCSDVVFGQDGGGTDGGGTAPAATASAPSEEQFEDGADESSVEHGGHGDDDASTGPGRTAAAPEATAAPEPPATTAAPGAAATTAPPVEDFPNAPAPAAVPGSGTELAETGGDTATPYLAVGGAAVLALGAAVLFGTARRRTGRG